MSLRDLAYSAYRSIALNVDWDVYPRYSKRATKLFIRKEKKFCNIIFWNGLFSHVLKGYSFSNDSNIRCNCNPNEINDYFANVVHIEKPDITDFVDFNDLDGSFIICICDDEVWLVLYKVKPKSIGNDGSPIRFI